MCWPPPSRAAQRRIEATTSSEVTAEPSENFEPVAQLEGVGELVVRDAVFRHHLRLRLHVLVEREQRVVDHRAVVGGDVRRRPDRVEGAQIPLHHGANRLARGGLRAQHRRRLGQRGGGRRGLQERAAGSSSWRPLRGVACECLWRALARLRHGTPSAASAGCRRALSPSLQGRRAQGRAGVRHRSRGPCRPEPWERVEGCAGRDALDPNFNGSPSASRARWLHRRQGTGSARRRPGSVWARPGASCGSARPSGLRVPRRRARTGACA